MRSVLSHLQYFWDTWDTYNMLANLPAIALKPLLEAHQRSKKQSSLRERPFSVQKNTEGTVYIPNQYQFKTRKFSCATDSGVFRKRCLCNEKNRHGNSKDVDFKKSDGSQSEINMFFLYTQNHTAEEILHQLLDGYSIIIPSFTGFQKLPIVSNQCRILCMRGTVSHTIPFTHYYFVIDYHTQVPSNSHVDLIGGFNPSKQYEQSGTSISTRFEKCHVVLTTGKTRHH